MKKQYIIGALVAMAFAATGCDDFLNDNRYPMSQQTVNSEFWSNPVNIQNQINYFYQDYVGYGNSIGSGDFYFTTLNDDQCGRNSFTTWTYVNVPASSTYWSDPYIEIRRAFLVLEGIEHAGVTGSDIDSYKGEAYLHIARNYFELVRCYGDVPLVKKALDPSSEAELYGARTNRNEVMDYVLECVDNAVNMIGTKSAKTMFSSDMAQAVKTEICLFEGSYARYHQKDETRAVKYYQEAVKAGEAIADSYPIGNDYTALYKSLRVAGEGYDGLTNNSEVIFMKPYEKDVFCHSLMDYSTASDGVGGLTKDAFDSYLFADGKPKGLTSLDDTDIGEAEGDNALSIANLLAVRDQRLAMTTFDHVFFPGMAWAASNTVAMWSMSGYGVSKYLNYETPSDYVNVANKNYTCAPLFWGARLYLAIAEAKAELGTISNEDVIKYLHPLWDRAGVDITNLSLTDLQSMSAPDNDMNVSSLIWEIRRCRRCELIMDDNIRYWDLVRWHQLDKLDTQKNPDIVLGAYVANAPIACSSTVNGYCNASYGSSRVFSEREYLFPIPTDQITLNPNLKQNPGWESPSK